MSKRKKLLTLLCIPVIALVCEVLLFNFSAWTSLGRDWTPLPEPTIEGNLAEDKRMTLTFEGLNQDIRWCHIAIELLDTDGQPLLCNNTLEIEFSDDGNMYPYPAGSVQYCSAHSETCYFQINSYGKVHDLTVKLKTVAKECSYRILSAEINGSVPFHFSLLRFFGLFLVLWLLWFLRHASRLHDNRFWNRRPRLKSLSVAMILLLNLLLTFCLEISNPYFLFPSWEHHRQYQELARSLSEGKTWIDTPEQAEILQGLSELENPYDRVTRTRWFESHNLTSPWDIAYHGNHLYVYFGVVPVLLSYLPYYLLTGNDLSTVLAAWVAMSLIVIGAFLCMRGLIRRYFPTVPFTVYLMLSVLLGNCTGMLTFALEPSFYTVPISFALAFALLALALWNSAAERWEILLGRHAAPVDPELLCFAPVGAAPRPGGIGLRIAFGSLLAALVAGCRPQFLVFTALALPIFWPLMRGERHRPVTLRRIFLFSLPYLAVAIPLAYYNKIRFGSPFDFGANYNLTTNDMTRRGFHLTRLPDGLFAYLFALPNLKLQFPFYHATDFSPLYIGKTIQESMFGGALVSFPFLWLLFAVRRVCGVLREKKLLLFFAMSLGLALVVVIADTEMAGVLWRYTGDYLALLYLPASLVCCAMLEQAPLQRRRQLANRLIAVTGISLLICLLIAISNAQLGPYIKEFLI